MNNLLKYVPGFRSNTKWKKIVATVYYAISLFMLAVEPGMFLAHIATPFLIFSIIDLIQYKKKAIPVWRTIATLLISLVVFNLASALNPSLFQDSPDNIDNNVASLDETTQNKDENISDIFESKQEESNTITENPKQESDSDIKEDNKQSKDIDENPKKGSNDILKVHFMDVGQADSILIHGNSASMLVDAGNNADANSVVNYIKNQGITKLDYVIGTHPHEDHIGGLDAVVNSFDVGTIIMPKVSHTTKTYEDVLLAIKSKGMKITAPTPGSEYKLGSAQFKILAPSSSSYEDLNNYSVVVKVTFKNTSFLLTGDAEDVSENEMLANGFDLRASLLKIGHHGSGSSTISKFLDKVNPQYAVISVGKDNDYGHPHQETMEKLQSRKIKVYRTDENGNIIATSDGNTITFNCNPGSYAYSGTSSESGGDSNSNSNKESSIETKTPTVKTEPEPSTPPPASNNDRVVYWTPNGKSYHYSKDCRTLKRSKTILEGPLSECPKSDPCDVCVR